MTQLLVVALPLLVIAVLMVRMGAPPKLTLTADSGVLHVRLGFWDGIYCVRRSLELPLDDIEGVAAAPRNQVPRTGLRLPGSSLPGVIRAGTYSSRTRKEFWDVRRGELYLVIEMRPGAAYRRLVLEVPDPHAEALRLRPILGAYAGTFRD